jgi:hypothetical protein
VTQTNHAAPVAGERRLTPLIDALRSSGDGAGFTGAVDAAFRALAVSGAPEAILQEHVAALAGNPHFETDAFHRNSLTLFEDEAVTLYIRLLRPATSAKLMFSTGRADQLMAVLTEGRTLEVRSYRFDAPRDLAVFDPAARIALAGNVQLSRASGPILSRGGDIVDYVAAESLALLVLEKNETVPFQWGFDVATLAPLFSSTTRSGLSRLETLIELVRELISKRVDPATLTGMLERLCEHPMHFVRWKAVQALSEVDRDAGFAIVRKMADDPHPHVAAAAARIVARVSAAAATPAPAPPVPRAESVHGL